VPLKWRAGRGTARVSAGFTFPRESMTLAYPPAPARERLRHPGWCAVPREAPYLGGMGASPNSSSGQGTPYGGRGARWTRCRADHRKTIRSRTLRSLPPRTCTGVRWSFGLRDVRTLAMSVRPFGREERSRGDEVSGGRYTGLCALSDEEVQWAHVSHERGASHARNQPPARPRRHKFRPAAAVRHIDSAGRRHRRLRRGTPQDRR